MLLKGYRALQRFISKYVTSILWISTLLWIASMWHHSATPGVVSSAQSDAVVQDLWNIFTFMGVQNIHTMVLIVRKSAHILEYMVFGILLTCLFIKVCSALAYLSCCLEHSDVLRTQILQLGLVFILGACVVPACDETIQLFVPGRSGQLTDCFIDLVGVAFGVCIVAAIYKHYKNRA
ncbi:VanZ family protein [Fannyhessea vaginae]|uniref:VanZ family protein n=1 Tax=Fannyhessea vaginae TaxID=82135 RepID=UPI002889B290|nr:VanZ family protein [Fannyhessea vaginae]